MERLRDFFPAATGISAGANMSGDLEDPAKSIPRGTLLAILFTASVYAAQIVLTAGVTDRADLQANPFGSLQEMSVFGPLIIMGVFAATLSSALGSFLGAPRILQAMGQDRLMKPLVFFGKGSGPANEPRRATVLSFLIGVAVIWLAILNAVAEIISMFFLIAYGMINLSAFVESKSANPSFRPRFKWFHWTTGLAGVVGCVVAMLKINDTYALVAFAITSLLYFYLRKRDIKSDWGDAKRGFIFQRTRDSLLYLETSKFHPKNWRPILAVISPDPVADRRLLQIGGWLEGRRGLYTVAEIHESADPSLAARVELRRRKRGELRHHLQSLDLVGFAEVVVVDDFEVGLSVFLQSYAVGGLEPNTLMMSIPPPHDAAGRERFVRSAEILRAYDANLVLLKPADFVLDRPQRVIDFWWRGSRNGSLMALLAYLTTLDRTWQRSKDPDFPSGPRPLRGCQGSGQAREAGDQRPHRGGNRGVQHPRRPVAVHPARSGAAADLVMLGLSSADLESFPAYMQAMDPLLVRLPTTLLVWSNGEADLFA